MAKIFACGDIVNYYNESGYLCSEDLANLIKSTDYAVCNFEAPIKGYGKPVPKSGPHLHQSVETMNGLKSQGFDLLLLANNHMLDYGREGLEATIKKANSLELDVVGAGFNEEEAYRPLIKSFGGLKVGIINACEAQFGVIDHYERRDSAGYAWINHPKIDLTVLKLKKECDFVLVFSHAGLENYSIPQKEWRIRYKHLCDLGADVVIGSHPHVPQGYEEHNGSLIFYSLGNFYFDYGYARKYKNHSYAVIIELIKGEVPNFKPVHHITEDKQVVLSQVEVALGDLCNQLHDGYRELNDEMSLKVYEGIVKKNLARSISSVPTDGTVSGILKEIGAKLLGRRRTFNKHVVQLHLMRNEAYYYAARRALEIQSEMNLRR